MTNITRVLKVLTLAAVPALMLAQNAQNVQNVHRPAGDNVMKQYPVSDHDDRPYDKHDFNGLWARIIPLRNMVNRRARNAATRVRPTATSAMFRR